MIDCMFYQQYHSANSSQGIKMKVFANDRIVFRSWEGLGCSFRQWQHFIVSLFDHQALANKRQKKSMVGFIVFSNRLLLRLPLAPNKSYDSAMRKRTYLVCYLALPSRFVYLWREQGAKGDFCAGERDSSRSLALHFYPQFLTFCCGYCNLVYNHFNIIWIGCRPIFSLVICRVWDMLTL